MYCSCYSNIGVLQPTATLPPTIKPTATLPPTTSIAGGIKSSKCPKP
jgi:hypothetical protein